MRLAEGGHRHRRKKKKKKETKKKPKKKPKKKEKPPLIAASNRKTPIQSKRRERERERKRERETATPAALFAAADKDDAVRGPAMQMAPIESTPSTASIRFVEINDAIDAISNRNGIYPPPTPQPHPILLPTTQKEKSNRCPDGAL